MLIAARPPLWELLLGYLVLLPVFAVLLHGLVLGLGSAVGIGRNRVLTKRKLVREWAITLAVVYAYVAASALHQGRWWN